MWDESKITVTKVLKGGYSIYVKCLTICKKAHWISNVYCPTDFRERKFIWPELQSLSEIVKILGVGGDFNIT